MRRNPVSSSNLASIGYDSTAQVLEVEFINRAIYQYYNVPSNMYEELKRAGSKGKFFHQYIRNAYAYSRVG